MIDARWVVVAAAATMAIGCGGSEMPQQTTTPSAPKGHVETTTSSGASVPGTANEGATPDATSTTSTEATLPTGAQTATATPNIPLPPPTTPDEKKPQQIAAAQASFDQSKASFLAAAGCAQMCKALASMSRSADALCALTLDATAADRARCDSARAKVLEATNKVKATCGGCE